MGELTPPNALRKCVACMCNSRIQEVVRGKPDSRIYNFNFDSRAGVPSRQLLNFSAESLGRRFYIEPLSGQKIAQVPGSLESYSFTEPHQSRHNQPSLVRRDTSRKLHSRETTDCVVIISRHLHLALVHDVGRVQCRRQDIMPWL